MKPNAADRKNLIAAVEKFTELHERHELDLSTRRYRDLLPSSTPSAGYQYAFEVDLDKCTGCKACVTACHNENGLDEDETWRSVGLIEGGTSEEPVMQHVTAACHHCAEPACMIGCPTNAYVKDTATGIVKHLEDQCFGCQYCILKCPYDVPKYNKKRGIVHKCDMCMSRLNAGQAPACVRACPNDAIRITLVKVQDVKKKPEDFVNVPDAPSSDYTYPTTQYKTKRKWPDNMASIDYMQLKPEHSHWPLVVMLVLTQLSVGTILAELMLKELAPFSVATALSATHWWVALAMGMLAMGVSILHLGRPLYAFRAVLGLRTSWLSREILAFGVFALAAILRTPDYLLFIIGLAGVICSVMVYRDTKRPFWDNHMTTAKFLMTMVILGLSMSLVGSLGYLAVKEPSVITLFWESTGRFFCGIVLCFNLVKMILEAAVLGFLRSDDSHVFKKTAILMTMQLKKVTLWRYVLGLIGGIALPLFSALIDFRAPNAISWIIVSVSLSFILLLVAELLERYLFFRAVVSLQTVGRRLSPATSLKI